MVITNMRLSDIVAAFDSKHTTIDKKTAQRIRTAAKGVQESWNPFFQRRYLRELHDFMTMCDELLKTFGVEEFYIRTRGEDRAVRYCNTGDSYATTIMEYNGKIHVSCWGFFAETYKATSSSDFYLSAKFNR